MTSKAELEGLRAHAAALQTEWRSVRAAAPEARLEKEREVEADALRAEIARMQGVLTQEVKSSGGTTEEALEAMQRAVELERTVTEAHTVQEKGEVSDDEAETQRPPGAYTSSSIAASPGVPVPGHEKTVEEDGDPDNPFPDVYEDGTEGDEKEEEGSR